MPRGTSRKSSRVGSRSRGRPMGSRRATRGPNRLMNSSSVLITASRSSMTVGTARTRRPLSSSVTGSLLRKLVHPQAASQVLPRPVDVLCCFVSKKNLASLHVPPVIFMSISSPITAGGSQELDGQWLEEIASYGPPDLLLTPCLGIAPNGGGRKGC